MLCLTTEHNSAHSAAALAHRFSRAASSGVGVVSWRDGELPNAEARHGAAWGSKEDLRTGVGKFLLHALPPAAENVDAAKTLVAAGLKHLKCRTMGLPGAAKLGLGGRAARVASGEAKDMSGACCSSSCSNKYEACAHSRQQYSAGKVVSGRQGCNGAAEFKLLTAAGLRQVAH